MAPIERDARCAVHSDLTAVGTCARCGDFYCQACGDGRHPSVCVRCGALRPSGIAWEDPRYGGPLTRYVRSLRELVTRPQIAFPGPARVGPSIRFAALSGAVIGLLASLGGAMVILEGGSQEPGLGIEWFREGPLEKGVAFVLVNAGAVLLSLGFALGCSISFSFGLLGVGRSRGLFRIALRAASYAQGITLLSLAPPLGLSAAWVALSESELLSLLTRLGWLGCSLLWLFGTTRVFFWAGRGIGLPASRASVAAAGPWLLSLPLTVLIFETHLDPLLGQVAHLL